MRTTALMLFLLIGPGLVACSSKAKDPNRIVSDPSQPGTTAMTVRTSSGTFTSDLPAALDATFSAQPTYSLSLGGVTATQVWGVTALLSASQASQASGNLQVASNSMLVEGAAILGVSPHSGPNGPKVTAKSGTMQFSVSGGRITGSVTAQPPELSATFEGEVVVSCYVSPASLPRGTDGPPGFAGGLRGLDGGSMQNLVPDDRLTSPECSALASWRR